MTLASSLTNSNYISWQKLCSLGLFTVLELIQMFLLSWREVFVGHTIKQVQNTLVTVIFRLVF